MTDDLITWLRAQLNEDERVARHLRSALPDVPSERRFSYDFLLADVAAKRRLLDALEAPVTAENVADEEGLISAVQIIAIAYADREGYRPEWAA